MDFIWAGHHRLHDGFEIHMLRVARLIQEGDPVIFGAVTSELDDLKK